MGRITKSRFWCARQFLRKENDMGGDSGESTSGETENIEVSSEVSTNDCNIEISDNEIASAFDEKVFFESNGEINETVENDVSLKSTESDIISEDEVSDAFDENKENTDDFVSEKVENHDYCDNNSNIENKEVIGNNSENDAGKYDRPTSYREGVRDQVWENAEDEHGRVRDPVTGKYMSKEQPWDMGHKPGYEFSKHQESAKERQISRKEFLDEHNNPDHYRPELPSSNRSHKGESKTENYYSEEE